MIFLFNRAYLFYFFYNYLPLFFTILIVLLFNIDSRRTIIILLIAFIIARVIYVYNIKIHISNIFSFFIKIFFKPRFHGLFVFFTISLNGLEL